MPSSGNRSEKLASSARKELADMISFRQLKELKDLKLEGIISITEVKVEKGYQHFRVFLSFLKEEDQKPALELLNDSIPAIRGELCRRLRLRQAPVLSFHLDSSLKKGAEMCKLLDSIKQDS